MSEQVSTTRRPPRRLVRLGLALLGLALLVAVGAALVARTAWRAPAPAPSPPADEAPAEPPDPRLAYAGPYRNVHPGVKYVGDAKCASCHKDREATYKLHPMGRSLARVAGPSSAQGLSADSPEPFLALGARLRVERKGNHTWHVVERQGDKGAVVAGLSFEAVYAIGSGTRGQSFLTERDGFLFQTPISWYAQKGLWGLSPGFNPTQLAGRPVTAECVFCHANRVKEVHGEQDHFRPGIFDGYRIGCERCHGPGELHAKERNEEMLWERPDRTIVNPKHLPHDLRNAVCEQCHLEGEARFVRRGRGLYDYRPGMPLHEFWSVYVPAAEPGKGRKAVNHVEQMYASKCFEKSKGANKLGCTSCHDPHVHVRSEDRPGRHRHYRAACLKCHDENKGQPGCTERLAERRTTTPPDSCIDCHMPRFGTTDVVHASSTDHRVVRRREKQPLGAEHGTTRLVNFYRDRLPVEGPEQERDRAVAEARRLVLRPVRVPPEVGAPWLKALDRAVARAATDMEAEELRAQVLLQMGRPGEAFPAFEKVVRRWPRRRTALMGAALAANQSDRPRPALAHWKRAVEVAPYNASLRGAYAALLMNEGAWAEARTQLEAARRIDPFDVHARHLWARLLLREGKKAEARAEMEVIRRLRPPDLAELERLFLESDGP
jgi:hypothetical protein